jgi:hypothetical protein
MRTRRVRFQKLTAFDIHATWRSGAPWEHFFELLAGGEFRHGFVPLLLPVKRNTLLVYSMHLDMLWGQVSLVWGTHLRRDTVIPQWFQASKAAAASDGHAVHC